MWNEYPFLFLLFPSFESCEQALDTGIPSARKAKIAMIVDHTGIKVQAHRVSPFAHRLCTTKGEKHITTYTSIIQIET